MVTVIMAQSPACLMDAGILPDSFSSGWFRLRAGPESVLFEHWQPGPWPVGCGNVPIVHSWSSSAQCHGGGLKRSKPASLTAGPGASSCCCYSLRPLSAAHYSTSSSIKARVLPTSGFHDAASCSKTVRLAPAGAG